MRLYVIWLKSVPAGITQVKSSLQCIRAACDQDKNVYIRHMMDPNMFTICSNPIDGNLRQTGLLPRIRSIDDYRRHWTATRWKSDAEIFYVIIFPNTMSKIQVRIPPYTQLVYIRAPLNIQPPVYSSSQTPGRRRHRSRTSILGVSIWRLLAPPSYVDNIFIHKSANTITDISPPRSAVSKYCIVYELAFVQKDRNLSADSSSCPRHLYTNVVAPRIQGNIRTTNQDTRLPIGCPIFPTWIQSATLYTNIKTNGGLGPSPRRSGWRHIRGGVSFFRITPLRFFCSNFFYKPKPRVDL